MANQNVPNTGLWSSISSILNLNFAGLEFSNQVTVKTASDLAGTLDSTKEYFIDGVIDMGSQSIEVPSGGLNFSGYNFNVSKLISSEPNYTMFTSPAGGSGDLVAQDYAIEVTGTDSKVYEINDATGLNALELARINYNNCTSLGVISGYRQGLESGTGRFGGTPELTLAGTWLGGYFIESSIARGLTDGAYSLYKAGAGFSMASRFRSNQNLDLNTSVAFVDFAPANFPNPNTLQLDSCIITRNGVFSATDSTITPNISKDDVQSSFRGNTGLLNTYVGGKLKVTSTVVTSINAGSTYYTLNANWLAQDMTHYDSPSAGQLRHLGVNPIEFRVQADFTVECTPNDVLAVRIRVWRDATSSFLEFQPQLRQVHSFIGGRDVAFFTIFTSIRLDQNDYIYFQIANNTGANDATLEVDSFYLIEER
ncbi:MAG: hypothetical protein V7765_21665 [Oleispira sp.]